MHSLKRTLLRLTLSAAACTAMLPLAAQTPDTIRLSLDSCMSIALSDNPLIKVAGLEIERTDWSRRETIGQLLPSISFDGQYGRSLAKQTMYMNMDAFGGMGGMGGGEGTEMPESRGGSGSDGGIKIGLDNSYTLGFSAQLPLIAPQLWKTLKLNDLQILENVEKARQSRLNTVNQVKNAYYGLLLAIESRAAVIESRDMAQLTADRYRSMFELGTASRFDTLRTAVALRNIEPQIVQADIAVSQARLQLAVLMGMNPLEVAITPDVTLADYAAYTRDDLSGMGYDMDNNADLRLLDVQTRELETAHAINKLAYIPTLAFSANYSWTTMSNGKVFGAGKWNPYSNIGLNLSVPIFQGGQRYSRTKQSAIQVAEMQWQRDNLLRNLNTQAAIARDNIRLNLDQIESCALGVEQADAAYRIQYDSFYGIGAASYLDLRDSELALTQARLQHLQAIYNYLVARSDLELLCGTAEK